MFRDYINLQLQFKRDASQYWDGGFVLIQITLMHFGSILLKKLLEQAILYHSSTYISNYIADRVNVTTFDKKPFQPVGKQIFHEFILEKYIFFVLWVHNPPNSFYSSIINIITISLVTNSVCYRYLRHLGNFCSVCFLKFSLFVHQLSHSYTTKEET